MTAEVCRETDTRPSTPAARWTACKPVRRLSVTPGHSEQTDTLPPALQTEPLVLLTYRVQIFNSTGHSAGESATAAFVASGTPPPVVTSFQATASEHGAILEWHSAAASPSSLADRVDFNRVNLSIAPASEKKPKSAAIHPAGKIKAAQPKPDATKTRDEVHLKAADIAANSRSETAGTVDTTAIMGDTYTYIAQRVRTVKIGGRELEIKSDPSPVLTLVMRDTFPPKIPSGLETISGTSTPPAGAPSPYVDLSWEPNAEDDLAGYRVYRQLATPDGSPQGPIARLTALPITAPTYRDVAVKAGQGYIYTVTAVDAAGNESAPSAKALEVLSPEAGKSPN